MKQGCDEAVDSEGLIEHSVSIETQVKSFGDSCKKKKKSLAKQGQASSVCWNPASCQEDQSK